MINSLHLTKKNNIKNSITKRYFAVLVLFTIFNFTNLQDLYASKVSMRINHKLGNEEFGYNKAAKNNLNNSFELTRMEYYLSDFTIIHDGGIRTKIDSSFMLIKASKNPMTNQIVDLDTKGLNITNIEGLEFGVGVPAPINNEDPTKWSQSHPLSPKSPSMHWGWAAGYRFVAMEGFISELSNTPLEVHALNNENYKLTSFNTNVKADENGDFTIVFDADYTRALENLDISAGLINHSGEGEAVTLLKNFRELVFTPIIISTVEAINSNDSKINIFPNPNNGEFTIDFNELNLNQENKLINQVKIYNNLGKLVNEISDLNSNTINIKINQKGNFVIGLYNDNELLSTKKVVIE